MRLSSLRKFNFSLMMQTKEMAGTCPAKGRNIKKLPYRESPPFRAEIPSAKPALQKLS